MLVSSAFIAKKDGDITDELGRNRALFNLKDWVDSFEQHSETHRVEYLKGFKKLVSRV